MTRLNDDCAGFAIGERFCAPAKVRGADDEHRRACVRRTRIHHQRERDQHRRNYDYTSSSHRVHLTPPLDSARGAASDSEGRVILDPFA